MKILIILSALEMGGIERMLISSVPYYKAHGFDDIHILCSKGGSLRSEFIELGLKIHIDKKNASPLFRPFIINRLNRKYRFSVINSNLGHTSGITAVACKILKVPFFISVHNSQSMFKLGWKKRFFHNYLRKAYLTFEKFLSLSCCDLIIGHSKVNLNYFRGSIFGDRKLFPVHNGVDFDELLCKNKLSPIVSSKLSQFVLDATCVFINIGRFKPQKNHQFLLNAFSKLKPIENGLKLILLGDGEIMADAVKLSRELNISEAVLFAGMDINIMNYLSVSHVFVFPSLYEGFGNVLIEAQYIGLPILASDILAHYESVSPSYHKYFFNPTSIDDFVLKFNYLKTDMGSRNFQNEIEISKKFAHQFTIENMVNEIMSEVKLIVRHEI